MPDELKNKAQFINDCAAKFFKPGVITFVVNFDMGDLLLMMTNFEIQKPGLQVLLMVTQAEFQKWGLDDRPSNMDCCIHQGAPTKTMMQKLGIIERGQ